MDVIELYNTIQLTFVSSVQPDSDPVVSITDPNGSVTSLTSISSDSTHYYSLYTTNVEGVHVGKWGAQKTVVGSAYNFSKAFLFNVKLTRK